MPGLQAVIFDLDGTLFDHRGAAVAGLSAWLAEELRVAPTPELLELWFEVEERHLTAWHRGEASFEEQRRRRLRDLLPVAGVAVGPDAELDLMFAGYAARYEAAWRTFGDVEQGLAAVQQLGLPTAVLTNGAERIQRRKLAAVGLSDRLGPLFCCDELALAKPDPRAYRTVCWELGVEPERALHVGDRYDLDVVAARAAGLEAAHVDRAGEGRPEEPHRLRTLTELGPLLRRLT
jgi:putative hydrolase of the HAD superfamily